MWLESLRIVFLIVFVWFAVIGWAMVRPAWPRRS